jgi:hypothetical protein
MASHGADTFRYLSLAYRNLPPPPPAKALRDRPTPNNQWALRGIESITVGELFKRHLDSRGKRERI